ncbi:MAG: toll/interleukin-1 receptor domain-containing protein [Methanosarcinaceae archaeon]
MAKPLIFISYSHKDELEKEELVKHLSGLRSDFDTWIDDGIKGGDDWENEIEQAMEQATIAIMLISANFLVSDFIRKQEIPHLLQQHKDEELIIFPIIIKYCAWDKVDWLSKMNVRPKNGLPVWRDDGKFVDEELTKIVKEIRNLLAHNAEAKPVKKRTLGDLDEKPLDELDNIISNKTSTKKNILDLDRNAIVTEDGDTLVTENRDTIVHETSTTLDVNIEGLALSDAYSQIDLLVV